jgi:hypothetical protein
VQDLDNSTIDEAPPKANETNNVNKDAGSLSEGVQSLLSVSEDHNEELAAPANWVSWRPISRKEYDSLSQYDKGYFKVDPQGIAKRERPSPSIHLIQALKAVGKGDLLEPTLPDGTFDQSTRSRDTWQIPPSNSCSVEAERDTTISLQSITAKFIRWKTKVHEPSWEEEEGFGIIGMLKKSKSELKNDTDQFIPPLSNQENDFLLRQGFTTQDVLLWASIIAERDTIRAARSLATHASNLNGFVLEATSRIPVFVLNFLLRREHIPADALRTLLQYTLEYLEYRWRLCSEKLEDQHGHRLGPIDGSVVFLLFIRLVRHARMVWPPAVVTITSIIILHYLPSRDSGHSSGPTVFSPDEAELFTRHCNLALYLLSLPTSLNPMHSATHQQRAQFDLIRKMVELKPALPVTRQGHRALSSVLLRLKKTPQERDWARLKAPSWPPFRQSKTRLDDMKGSDYGMSRAGRALQYMQEYGYPLVDIDFATKILSGFHIDGSPTIQTREIVLGRDSGSSLLWAAMVSSTRTLPEAWACFLKYKETVKPLHHRVYLAIFKKMAYDQIRTAEVSHTDAHDRHDDFEEVLPGDGRETFPAPEDPTDAIYIPSEPPSIESLFDQMISEGVQPDIFHTQFLMSRASTFEFGLKAWAANQVDIPTLLNDRSQNETTPGGYLSSQEQIRSNDLPPLSPRAITAFVGLLCKFTHADTSSLRQITNALYFTISTIPGSANRWALHVRHPFIHAYLLVKAYKLSYRAAWTQLIYTLAQPDTMANIGEEFPGKLDESHPLMALILVQDVVNSMKEAGTDIDTLAFRYLCDIAQNAAPAVQIIEYDTKHKLTQARLGRSYHRVKRMSSIAKQQLTAYPHFLRIVFTRLVGMSSRDAAIANRTPTAVSEVAPHPPRTITPLPSYLAVPNPAGLHAFVRALALYGDFEGIYSLVKWMVSAKHDIANVAAQESNGNARFRRCIVGVRALLESPGRDHRLERLEWRDEIEGAREELIVLVEKEIDSVPEWGGWASEKEVERYFRSRVGKHL